jgi:phage gp36-like protein
MAYATQAQIQMAAGGPERFVQLFDWDRDGVADANVIAEAQARADGWIDGFLRLRFSTPVANPSDTLVRLAADEAVYWCRKARGMNGLTPEDIQGRKDRELQLEAMRDGKLRPDEPLPAKSTAIVATIVENCDPVSREGLKGLF